MNWWRNVVWLLYGASKEGQALQTMNSKAKENVYFEKDSRGTVSRVEAWSPLRLNIASSISSLEKMVEHLFLISKYLLNSSYLIISKMWYGSEGWTEYGQFQ